MSDEFPIFPVSGTIRLGQFLKLSGLVLDGGEARELIQGGDVLVDGQVETRRGKQLAVGQVVALDTPQGLVGAVVGNS